MKLQISYSSSRCNSFDLSAAINPQSRRWSGDNFRSGLQFSANYPVKKLEHRFQAFPFYLHNQQYSMGWIEPKTEHQLYFAHQTSLHDREFHQPALSQAVQSPRGRGLQSWSVWCLYAIYLPLPGPIKAVRDPGLGIHRSGAGAGVWYCIVRPTRRGRRSARRCGRPGRSREGGSLRDRPKHDRPTKNPPAARPMPKPAPTPPPSGAPESRQEKSGSGPWRVRQVRYIIQTLYVVQEIVRPNR